MAFDSSANPSRRPAQRGLRLYRYDLEKLTYCHEAQVLLYWAVWPVMLIQSTLGAEFELVVKPRLLGPPSDRKSVV